MVQVDQFEQFIKTFIADALDVSDDFEIINGVEIRVEIGCFKECADLQAGAIAVSALKPGIAAAILPDNIEDNAQGGRFTTAVGAQNSEYTALGHFEIELVDRYDTSVAFGEAFNTQYGHAKWIFVCSIRPKVVEARWPHNNFLIKALLLWINNFAVALFVLGL